MRSTRKLYQKKRWYFPGIIVVVILIVWVTGLFTPNVYAYLMKPLINQTRYTAPEHIDLIKSRVQVEKDIEYNTEIENSFLDIYYPNDAEGQLPVVMLIHGGGFLGGSKESTQDYGMALADKGFVVANMDYAFAPKYKYPTPIIQANDALQYLNAHAAQYHGDMNRLFISGNSSGAQIAGQVAAVITDEELARTMNIVPAVGKHQLKGALLFCGAYNMDTLRATHKPLMSTFIWAYTGVKHYEAYDRIDEMSTVQHITPDYPPVFISVGNKDVLESQSIEMIQALQAHHIEVESVLFDDNNYNLQHDYQYNFNLAAARQTFEKSIQFLTSHSQ